MGLNCLEQWKSFGRIVWWNVHSSAERANTSSFYPLRVNEVLFEASQQAWAIDNICFDWYWPLSWVKIVWKNENRLVERSSFCKTSHDARFWSDSSQWGLIRSVFMSFIQWQHLFSFMVTFVSGPKSFRGFCRTEWLPAKCLWAQTWRGRRLPSSATVSRLVGASTELQEVFICSSNTFPCFELVLVLRRLCAKTMSGQQLGDLPTTHSGTLKKGVSSKNFLGISLFDANIFW